jgi:ComF family protein
MFASLFAAAASLSPSRNGAGSECAVCLSWPSEAVCAACITRFAPAEARCRTCALLLPIALPGGGPEAADRCIDCLRHPPPLDATFAAVSYAYPWSALVARYKFGNQPEWAGALSRIMLRGAGVADALQTLHSADWLLPLPLSSERLQIRGFNQAWQLAQALAAQSRTAANADAALLLRARDTPPQSRLSRAERLRNVEDAFVVDPLRAGLLQGRRVLLIDDVMTSGASLFSAARTLRQAGALHVSAVVFARTEQP